MEQAPCRTRRERLGPLACLMFLMHHLIAAGETPMLTTLRFLRAPLATGVALLTLTAALTAALTACAGITTGGGGGGSSPTATVAPTTTTGASACAHVSG